MIANPAGGASGIVPCRRRPAALKARVSQDFHLIEHPMLGRCGVGHGRPASTASIAARRLAPVTGCPLFGRLSSSWPA
jgi:hypothetical protein